MQAFNDPNGAPSPFQDAGALNAPERRNLDTHLLFNADDLLAAGADANEPSIQSATANDGVDRLQGYVAGAVLSTGAQDIVGAKQANALDIFRLVIRPGFDFTIQGTVSITGESEPRTVFIPEPTSLFRYCDSLTQGQVRDAESRDTEKRCLEQILHLMLLEHASSPPAGGLRRSPAANYRRPIECKR